MSAVTPIINSGSSSHTDTVNSTYGLIETIAKQTFYGVEAKNPLSSFDKGNLTKGTDIEQWMIQLTESYAFDKTATDVFSAKDPTYLVRYFKDWTKRQYEQSVRDDDIRKILTGENSVEDVASKIVANLRATDDNEKYENMKAIFAKIKSDMTEGSILPAGTATTATEFLKMVRNVVDEFQFMSSDYSIAGAKYRCPFERIRIVMPYGVKNSIDVEKLASLFHVEKAEIEARIDIIDTTDGIVYIVDEEAILHYNRLNEIENERNIKGRVDNYYLTTDDLFAYSPLFKTTYIDASAID